ncbi:hypothetical protein [Streptomyces sp. R08]|uniref:Integrase n=1 Tax=Streptomyces sp. R08 TaxID=3238624 RepID=A0AB39MNC4_9ACTN
MPASIDQLVKPVIELCEYCDVVQWQLTPTALDCYFAGPGKRARSTVLAKISKIDAYFAFLEQRYAGEVHRLFGAVVESPVDPFNRPRHRGDFGLRVPPSQRAMREFFTAWRNALPQARKEAVACRDYVMAKIAYVSGLRSCAALHSGTCTGSRAAGAGSWSRAVHAARLAALDDGSRARVLAELNAGRSARTPGRASGPTSTFRSASISTANALPRSTRPGVPTGRGPTRHGRSMRSRRRRDG